ncbi:MAG: DMT family transporter [Clostridia bacterium]|nr:DMT family transporter [Clostridia bacterium]
MYYLWLWLILISGAFLGLYDIFKKKALQRNTLFSVLALYSSLCFIIVAFEFTNAIQICRNNLLLILLKAVIIFFSWILGFISIKNMPISVITPFGTLSPLFSIILGIIVLNEKMGYIQLAGILIALLAYYFIGKAGAREVKGLFRSKYLYFMVLSMALSATSALIDKIALKNVNTGQLQFWFSLFLAALYISAFLANKLFNKKESTNKKSEDTLLKNNIKKIPYFIILMSIFLVISDRIYYFAVKMPDSQISVIMPLRKISILVSALVGGYIFKEENLKSKFYGMCLLGIGIILIFAGK